MGGGSVGSELLTHNSVVQQSVSLCRAAGQAVGVVLFTAAPASFHACICICGRIGALLVASRKSIALLQ